MSNHDNVFVGRPPVEEIIVGRLYTHTSVKAANVAKDLVENVKNVFGGRMNHYSKLIDSAVGEAINELLSAAIADGYHGVCELRIVAPVVVDGGVEIVVYGNGYILPVPERT
uniref:Uncharacterized conserved protein YbjQ, UPF0145 family n=1 Tax=Candidatus Kentrum sp. LPFa TaxID=2126335 RepID=A0A450VNB9_9GAMM|nr:MAG: Uncharacterized conserved protein YbjQ, UPF0145 family [Candidatus Kentron sp. LPFa]VFK23526.1 MAG: Uncharacterized conserved protein YbjQ, UPF0145 family [Candidatus Kentron sp. LPFa]